MVDGKYDSSHVFVYFHLSLDLLLGVDEDEILTFEDEERDENKMVDHPSISSRDQSSSSSSINNENGRRRNK